MIQEHKDLLHIHKDLLLKDLSARLPYKVKVEIKNVSKICTLEEIDCSWEEMSVAVKHENGELAGYDFVLAKPYLFPLSSMTEEQKQEYTYIVNYISSDDTENWKEGEFIYVEQFTQLMRFYLVNHFDYMGLIPIGLANNAVGLNIY